MSNTSENLCYLLWKHKLNREEWSRQLAEWAKCSQDRANELLGGTDLRDDEQKRIAQVLNISEEDLQYSRLVEVEQADILHLNVIFLLEHLEHGKKRELAENLSVHPTTLNKWERHEQSPSPSHQTGLRRYFNISSSVDLTRDPIFLSHLPVIDLGRREWLQQRIKRLSAETLEELFPALVRLLRGK